MRSRQIRKKERLLAWRQSREVKEKGDIVRNSEKRKEDSWRAKRKKDENEKSRNSKKSIRTASGIKEKGYIENIF